MRAVIQRVSSASVAIDGVTTVAIGCGLLVLVGVARDDVAEDASWLARKIGALRVFADCDGRMNRSVVEIAGGVLAVSQFTLIASTRKGTRPSFNDAAKPESAVLLYEAFVRELELATGRPVATGVFGAAMQISLVNDGPVTLVIDSRNRE